jgi:hypothetical protein
MSVIDRVAQGIARQRNCLRQFPCPRCDDSDAFDGAGCRILATAAIAALLPSATTNNDDDQRAGRVAFEMQHAVTVDEVAEVVERWLEAALTEADT